MNNLNSNKKQTFMSNVTLILFSQIMVKLLGMVYRLVITNVPGFGDAGNGFYSAGFNVYTLLLAISSVGIPNAIAKMVSERTALGDYRGAHKIFKTAFVLFAGIGLFCTLLLIIASNFVAKVIIHMDGVQYTLIMLAPSIFFVCISSVIRGYFSGMHNMKATSYSQMIEQIFKCSVTVLIVVILIGQKPEIMAAGANLATSISTVISLGYLMLFYKKHRPEIMKNAAASSVEPENKKLSVLMKSILMISIPISLGSVITAINRLVDTATITRGIEIAFAAGIPGTTGIPTLEMLEDEAVRLTGILSKSDVLINMPLALNIAFSTVLVPSIAGALAVGDKKEASGKVSYSLLISILLVLPCAAGYITLANPIYRLLYPNAKLGASLLQLSSVALIFTALNQTISGSLQGLGKIYVPATGIFCGCIAKFILNVLLIRIPSVNIYGAVISSIVCQIISFSICFTSLCRNITLKMGFVKYILKPLSCAVIMSAAALGSYKLLMMILKSNTPVTIISIAIAAFIYFLFVAVFKVLTKSEIEALPKGTKIYSMLVKAKLYK